MFGAWFESIHIRENRMTANSVAGEIVLDSMFWPSPARRFGWYAEPAYDYTFGRGHPPKVSALGSSLQRKTDTHYCHFMRLIPR